jgi:YD repeat-containing protein
VQITRLLLGVPSTQGGVSLSYTPVSHNLAYDGQGRLISSLDPVGMASQVSYNAQGLPSRLQAPALLSASAIPTTTSTEASSGPSSAITSSIPPSQRQISLAYNSAGDLVLITDALGQSTRLSSDTLGRPTRSTDPQGCHDGTARGGSHAQGLRPAHPSPQTNASTYIPACARTRGS